jgi:hypothetical protein
MTTPPEIKREKEKKKYPIPKTVRPKWVVVDDKKAYYTCPYRGCDFMVEDSEYDPKYGLHTQGFICIPEDKVFKHVKEVHGFVWLRKGKSAGWYPLSKFHPRPE